MNSLRVLQYDDIKTAIQATTQIGDFSLVWPEPIYPEVALVLDLNGFLVDDETQRVSWRDPAYPIREVPSLLDPDRAFISSCMTVLENISSNCNERYSNDSYYAHITARPNLPSAAIQFFHTYYVDRIGREDTTLEGSSSYFVSWTREFSVQNKYSMYRLLSSQYKDLFIHLS